MAHQPGRPIALFAPRRVGETFFLDGDVAPAARDAGLTPVYADLWLHCASPIDPTDPPEIGVSQPEDEAEAFVDLLHRHRG